MSVTANQLVKCADGCLGSGPVAATTHLYGGTLVFFNASGFVDDDIAAGVNKVAGIVKDEVDNSAGSNGTKQAEFYEDGVFELVGAGFSQADVQKPVYATDNYTIQLASENAVFVRSQ